MYIYAPLAHRLGLYSIKTELEDLALKHTESNKYSEIAKKIKETKKAKSDEGEKDVEVADDASIAKLILAFKEALGELVKDVSSSNRLTDSAVCLVAGEGDMDLHLERMLKMQGQMDVPGAARVLEINPTHPLIVKLSQVVDKPSKKDSLNDAAHLLFDQARIIEGETVPDIISFANRLNSILEKGF